MERIADLVDSHSLAIQPPGKTAVGISDLADMLTGLTNTVLQKMARYIRFIVRSDHQSRTRCTGVVASLRILGEEGRLPDYHVEYSQQLFAKLNAGLPCPPFGERRWSTDCVSWFKDTAPAQEWISVFRDLIAILEDSDIDVGTLVTDRPGMIVYEDDFQVVAQSQKY
ncbi:hypothetical protein [Luteolibacter marinus]|uniref:hypothetical protein n=1 Tax=Luteolibacter marinus TaxID=2776705 RepID=UPI001868D4F6|nr:hypothetical protein [Luteolibacter marinus]